MYEYNPNSGFNTLDLVGVNPIRIPDTTLPQPPEMLFR